MTEPITGGLAAFLGARYDEIEALAERLRRRMVKPDDNEQAGEPYWPTARVDHVAGDYTDPEIAAQVELIRIFSPQFVLADIAAKRAILAEYVRWQSQVVATRGDADYRGAYVDALEYVARSFAQPFASHPDFDPAWRLP